MIFWDVMFVPGGFSDLINQNNSNSNWKKLLGFRNMQEKLDFFFLFYVFRYYLILKVS